MNTLIVFLVLFPFVLPVFYSFILRKQPSYASYTATIFVEQVKIISITSLDLEYSDGLMSLIWIAFWFTVNFVLATLVWMAVNHIVRRLFPVPDDVKPLPEQASN